MGKKIDKEKIILGIDIGLTSIGWALIQGEETQNKDGSYRLTGKYIIDGGVNIFSNEGANTDRREYRLKRRQTRRRSMRIRRLVHALIGTGMLPIQATQNLRKNLHAAASIKKKERQQDTTPQAHKDLKDFFDLVPWELRKKAIEGTKLTPQELGRIFYHFAHQRGYAQRSLRSLEKETAKTLRKGDAKVDKIGAEYTQAEIAQHQQHPYLGHYLATLFPQKGTRPYDKPERIRNRYTYREMYEQEFDHIWRVQAKYHPQLLTKELQQEIRHILFYQLPFRIPPRGSCTFEPKKKRAYKASLLFFLFLGLLFGGYYGEVKLLDELGRGEILARKE